MHSSPDLPATLRGQRITVFGLGRHGGGAATAAWLVECGAEVTVTDLRGEAELAPSLQRLQGLPIRFVLNKHDERDFEEADMVVKNPAVPRSSPFLRRARRIETDISLFLATIRPSNRRRLIFVTGTKGKSTTASIIHHGLRHAGRRAHLAGNIAVSPLDILAELRPRDHIVLELSSFQLGDLLLCTWYRSAITARIRLPRLALIGPIVPDHLDYYSSMEEYVADKRVIYAKQGRGDWTICNDDDWGRDFGAESRARVCWVADECPLPVGSGACLDGTRGYFWRKRRRELLVPKRVSLRGAHNRHNLLAAALALRLSGVAATKIRTAVARFRGLEHRLEFVARKRDIDFYNDSAATIPAATLEALASFDTPPLLIAGGSDKGLAIDPFIEIAERAALVYLLQGSASPQISALFKERHIDYAGPFDSIESCVRAIYMDAIAGDIILLSPGCASFGMFKDEFDRGRRFRELVAQLPEE